MPTFRQRSIIQTTKIKILINISGYKLRDRQRRRQKAREMENTIRWGRERKKKLELSRK